MTSVPFAVPRRAIRRITLLLAGAAVMGQGQLQAQETQRAPGAIIGRVLDMPSGQGIVNATVRLLDIDRSSTLTNAQGQFRLSGVPVGVQEIEVTHIAYGRTTHLVNVPEGVTVELDVRLGFSPIVLDSLVAEVEVRSSSLLRSGFYERMRTGRGRYFHGDDMERWSPDQLLNMVPGVREVQGGMSAFDRRVVMRVRAGFGGNCYPEMILDGVRYLGSEGDLREAVGGLTIEAMEVYRGFETPAEFQGFRYPPCGAIVMWSRRG